MWVKPHSDGNLFVINFDRNEADNMILIATDNFYLKLQDIRFGDEFVPDKKLIEFYWTHIAVAVQWENELRHTTVTIWNES
jgi:hypothetical protein